MSKFRQKIVRGFTLIELIVVVSMVAILSATALDRLFLYQGQAEKAAMEYTAAMIKNALWMSMANLMMANNTPKIADLNEINPINLLEKKPENYLGEIENADITSLDRGSWFYDASKHQVVYIIKHRNNFQPSINGDFTVRYSTNLINGEIETSPEYKVPYVISIAFSPISKYTWH